MSIQIPTIAQLPRPKAYFYFYSPLQTIFDSPRVSDTTAVSTTSTTRVTLKTYTLSTPSGANKIRVVVWGYNSGPSATGNLYLNINGVDVASNTGIGNTTEAVLIDYIGDITAGSLTIRIDGFESSGQTLTVSKVFIATGIELTSTTPTTIATFTLTYQLLRQGDIRYSPGIRVFVFGNRKTTAPLTLTIPEATGITVGRNNLGAGNDNDKAETILAILTGSVTFQEGGEFTVSATLRGAVGATGDTVIITRIQARAQLRRERRELGEVRVYERGVAEYAGRLFVVPVPGGVGGAVHGVHFRDVQDRLLIDPAISGGGSSVVVFNVRVAVVTSAHFATSYDDDAFGETILEWASVVVWG
jgi:hypothetical protein